MNIDTIDKRIEVINPKLDEPVKESRGRKLQYIDLSNEFIQKSLKDNEWTSVFKKPAEQAYISEVRQVAKRYNNRGVNFNGERLYFIVQIIEMQVVLFATLSQPDSWEEVRKKYRV